MRLILTRGYFSECVTAAKDRETLATEFPANKQC